MTRILTQVRPGDDRSAWENRERAGLSAHDILSGMELLPEEWKKVLPRLGSGEGTPMLELTAHLRIVDPETQWRWYLIEYDGEDTCFGLIVSRHAAVAGQFRLSELETLRPEDDRPGVHRDESFEPRTLGRLIREEPLVAELFSPGRDDLVDLQP